MARVMMHKAAVVIEVVRLLRRWQRRRRRRRIIGTEKDRFRRWWWWRRRRRAGTAGRAAEFRSQYVVNAELERSFDRIVQPTVGRGLDTVVGRLADRLLLWLLLLFAADAAVVQTAGHRGARRVTNVRHGRSGDASLV